MSTTVKLYEPFFNIMLPRPLCFKQAFLLALCASFAVYGHIVHAATNSLDKEPYQAYASAAAFAATTFVPINAIQAASWVGVYKPKTGSNVAMSSVLLEAGAGKDNWRLGLERRNDTFAVLNKDFLDLYALYQQKANLPTPQLFSILGASNAWSGDGMAFRYQLNDLNANIFNQTKYVDKPLLDLKISAYFDSKYRDSQASGTVDYQSKNNVAFNALYNSVSTSYHLPFYSQSTNRARGFSLTAAGNLPLTDRLNLAWEARDLYSQLYINNIQGFKNVYDTATSSTDANGYVNYAAIMKGQNSQTNLRAKIKPAFAIAFDYQIPALHPIFQNTRVLTEIKHLSGITFPKIGIVQKHVNSSTTLSYDTTFKSTSLSYTAQNWQVGISSDSIHYKKARAFGLSAGYRLRF